ACRARSPPRPRNAIVRLCIDTSRKKWSPTVGYSCRSRPSPAAPARHSATRNPLSKRFPKHHQILTQSPCKPHDRLAYRPDNSGGGLRFVVEKTESLSTRAATAGTSSGREVRGGLSSARSQAWPYHAGVR